MRCTDPAREKHLPVGMECRVEPKGRVEFHLDRAHHPNLVIARMCADLLGASHAWAVDSDVAILVG